MPSHSFSGGHLLSAYLVRLEQQIQGLENRGNDHDEHQRQTETETLLLPNQSVETVSR